MTKPQQDLSYCFKPDCQNPKNDSDAVKCQCCGSSLLLQDRYRAVKGISRGDRERTFKAIDTGSGEKDTYCVIQQYLIPASKVENVRELLAIEAEKYQKINQRQQIPNLLEYFSEAGYQYIVREHIEGHRISQELAAYGAFKESEIRELLLDLLPILQLIHSHEIVHGNIRPENIVRRQSDRHLVLVNFTPLFIKNHSSYSPPEQIQDRATYASDIYSLGITCTHLLTQIEPKKLFKDRTNVSMWADCLICNNKLSESLAKIIDRMIRRYPQQQYYSIKEILKDLQPSFDLSLSLPPRSVIVGAAILAGLITARYFFNPAGQEIARDNNTANPIDITNNLASENPLENPSLTAAILSSNIDGEERSLAIEATKIKAKISQNFSVTEIEQTFFNPYQKPLEAVYEFTLPDIAVINKMEIQIGDRIVTGKIAERSEAIALFERAKEQEKTTAILQQGQNNLFTESVTNILPGEKIEIKIRYSKPLEFKNGRYQYRFPMSIIPQHKQEKGDRNLDLSVEIDKQGIYDIQSPTTPISVEYADEGAKVSLRETINPTREEFVLNYRIATPKNNGTVSTKTDAKGAYFAASITPAGKYNNRQITPKDFVFLIDTSGSQLGYPIAQSKELLRQFINKLDPRDRFTIIDFANKTNNLFDRPLDNTVENRKKALTYINSLQAKGRTKLIEGIDRVLDLPSPPDERSRAIILISDGASNNSQQIIATARKRLKPGNRFYTFAVGPSSDRSLINRLAQVGRGTATIVPPQAEVSEIVEEFITEIDEPVLTNVKINWLGAGEKPEIYPPILPDLFADRPLALYGHKSDRISGKLQITGTLPEGKNYERIIDINFDNSENDKKDFNSDNLSEQIPQYWGSAKVENLTDYTYLSENKAKQSAATNTALKYNILSNYTAFIAIGSEAKKNIYNLNREELD